MYGVAARSGREKQWGSRFSAPPSVSVAVASSTAAPASSIIVVTPSVAAIPTSTTPAPPAAATFTPTSATESSTPTSTAAASGLTPTAVTSASRTAATVAAPTASVAAAPGASTSVAPTCTVAAVAALLPTTAFGSLRHVKPDDVRRFEALGLFDHVELDPLILVQRTHAGAPNRTVVHEHVGAFFLLDETEAFLLGKPLYRPGRACHWSVPCVSERVSCVPTAQRRTRPA